MKQRRGSSMATTATDWRVAHRSKIISPQQAAQFVKSGSKVGGGSVEINAALRARAPELRDVAVPASAEWLTEEMSKSFRGNTIYVGRPMRAPVAAGLVDYLLPQCATYPRLTEFGRTERFAFDVFYANLSPPDRDGRCSFGLGLGWSKTSVMRSKIVVGQIDPSVPRTGGDNWVSIDDIDWLVESPPRAGAAEARPSQWDPTEEEANDPIIKGIAANWLKLIRDGDVLQFGAGKITFALPPWLASKRRLSIYTEICPAGVFDLMKTGVVDGQTNSRHPGKLVAVSLAPRTDQIPWIDGNPNIELYEFGYVNNPAHLSTIDNLVANNSCLAIDLFGQVDAESRDGHMMAGAGGQFEFVIGATLSTGGRSIHVLRSTDRDGSSNIVPDLGRGARVTISRNWTDFVVTECGIASLMGKSERGRAEELISVAHPKHRAELTQAAKDLIGF
ncbi:MAG: hypothetical protein EXR68_06325 [Dehalococcoidia bacterium]|nr:hypothetical protein [Dehalococcoidia bacterium]